ncbi:M24 family metallopeptidase [Mesorhizobium sp. CAU 1732]|uniref:M24 family metallopeptidase n=1 Tax=Mesorhizobium sp. CAU 1732 TaxID=3140358 RepID=UPI003260BDDD
MGILSILLRPLFILSQPIWGWPQAAITVYVTEPEAQMRRAYPRHGLSNFVHGLRRKERRLRIGSNFCPPSLCSMVQERIYRNGAESADPIAMLFNKGDFIYCRPPGTRRLEDGHYIWTDFRASYGGYPADRNRTARAGEPLPWEVELYELTRGLTVELASSIRSGRECCDVYNDFRRLWKDAGLDCHYGAISRIGHGGGLDVTEPPSISVTDTTVIRSGMILHFEPKLEHQRFSSLKRSWPSPPTAPNSSANFPPNACLLSVSYASP